MSINATLPPSPSLVTGWMTASDGARMPYRMKGDGPALIMVPGWSQSGAMFQHQLDHLSDRWTVIVPDIRGHGEAPEPDGGLRMARLARDLHELMAHLSLGSANLLGWSMGASVLWAFIDLFGTDAIDRLILVDQPSMLLALPGMDEEEIADAGAIFPVDQLYQLYAALRGPDGDATRAGFVAGMVTKSISPVLYDWILDENAKTSPKLVAELLLSHCTNDWRGVLARIDRPTLVIGGSVSHVPPRSQRFIHSRIAGSTYHEFDAEHGGAHFPFLEAPDAFNDVVAAFLSAK
ncbi:alpha/beta fold hydrolase [Sphingomonas bacterium]|uniref:alpha/beta fold hydrolase n=1 Tax=Sphingomonas bacterium TaxID=1895847 RepID=UPI0015766801|nr:alpha/beta hydrolase [Sphingomonas bacterium]